MNICDIGRDVVLVGLVLSGGWSDWRTGRISNWLTFPVMLFGVGVNVFDRGPIIGLLFSVGGLAAGLVCLLIPFYIGVVGGGDVKLLAAFGCLMGAAFIYKTIGWSLLFGGMIALMIHFRHRETLFILRRLFTRICLMISLRTGYLPVGDVGRPFPFGLAIVFGAFWIWWRA